MQQIVTNYYTYILRCADGTLYTGIARDVQRRLEEHNCGKGAKYTRGRSPSVLVYEELSQTKSDALRREYEIKRMDRQKKLNLIAAYERERL